MGFTVRFMLGLVLVLLSCWSLETVELQVNQNDTTTKSTDKNEKIENEIKANGSNLIENLSKENNEPKTDVSIDEKKPIVDNINSLIFNESNIKLQKSEPYKKTDQNPQDIARSINIEKYISKEFHNKNNVYTLPISADTEKFIIPDYEYHATTHNIPEHAKEFFNSDVTDELTTPSSPIFDHKFKEAVESVDQKLEHIDDSHEVTSEPKEELSLNEMYDATNKNDTKAELNYINYKNILANDSAVKNTIHKDMILESGTNLNFKSTYNKTEIIDETDDGNNTISKKPETSTLKNFVLTTRKSITLTKPPSNKNSSLISILSNNIETDTVKAIQPFRSNSLGTTEQPKSQTVTEDNSKLTVQPFRTTSSTTTEKSEADSAENDLKVTATKITNRGTVKFADYARVSTTPSPKAKKINSTVEQVVQANQIVSVHVEAPKNHEDDVETTTETVTTTELDQSDASTVAEALVRTETTTVENLTTTIQQNEETTTIEATTTTTLQDITTELAQTTTESLEGCDLTTSTIYNDQEATTTTPELTTPSNLRTSKSFTFGETVTTTSDPPPTTEYATSTDAITEIATTEPPSESSNIEEVLTTELPSASGTTVINTITSMSSTTADESEEDLEEEIEEGDLEKLKHPITTEIVVVVPYTSENNQTTLIPDLRSGPNYPLFETESATENSTIPDTDELNHSPEDKSGTIAAITISCIGAVCLLLLAVLLVVMRKRQKRFNYGQRCTPVSLDDYSVDNVSVYNSVRRKGLVRGSKRSYGNPAFEDPASLSHPLNFPALNKFATNLEDIKAEFEEIPQIHARTNELPEGCDTKNRYANVIPLPETRVFLTPIDGYPNSDYINANYVTGPKNTKGYYIACQAPMQNTVDDFWRMIWEQQSKVVLMLTHLFENGVEKCFDYLPPSEVLDCHRLFGDFQITLKKREVKDKYVISILQLKNMVSNSWREVVHFWYLGWPEKGVPLEANSLIAFLIEARSYMKSSSIDRKDVTNGDLSNAAKKNELNPVVVHCSPGTGRTGVVIACDIAIREFEQTRLIDIPRIVYKIRRDRASSVQTKEQYAFIYKVVSLYATKLTGGALDSL